MNRRLVNPVVPLLLPLVAGWAVGAVQTGPRAVPDSPVPAREAGRWLHLFPGLKAELVACEPQIESPVAMAFDERGRLWVVEMRDYPYPPKDKPPLGRIKLLEDSDGDGFYEKATVFAEQLLFANGILPWRGGVLVTCAPYVLYLRDTDGDGRADSVEKLFEGFATENPQLRVSHPKLGPDGWVYLANGLRGGRIRRVGKTDAPVVDIGGRDFRFDPLQPDRYGAVSGMGQYGNAFDDWGHRFVCDNRHHIRHVVMDERYFVRNPLVAAPGAMEDICELPLGAAGAGIRVYPLSRNFTTSNLHAGTFTSACSVHIYRGDALPEFYGMAFTCEPAGNLVHVERLRSQGPTFRSRPVRDGVEFLASPDDWFRPVYLYDGPDGALYVVDMYRAVIEHPEWWPPEWRNRPDIFLGQDRGRIWRIVPEKGCVRPTRTDLSRASDAELVSLLAHANGWHRTTAARLLLERMPVDRTSPLARMLRREARHAEDPRARFQAGWLVVRAGLLDEELLLDALHDPHAAIRQAAVVWAEEYVVHSARVRDRVLALAQDRDAAVVFQVALALGQMPDDARVVPVLASIAGNHAADRWIRLAVSLSVPAKDQAGAWLLEQIVSGPDAQAQAELLSELAELVGARSQPREILRLICFAGKLADARDERLDAAALILLRGLLDGLSRRGKKIDDFLQPASATTAEARQALSAGLQAAASIAAAAEVPVQRRTDAIVLLAYAPALQAMPSLQRLATTEPSQALRLAAVQALARRSEAEVAGMLLRIWPGQTPPVRREILQALVRTPDRTRALLDALEKGDIKAADLDPNIVRHLTHTARPDLRMRAQKLLAKAIPPERTQVLARYRAALQLAGDAARGRQVFQKNCANCHRVAGLGLDVGPDISDTRVKTPEQLLNDILNPNAAVDGDYVNYIVTTRDGRVFTGIVAAETSASILLKRAGGQTDAILKQDIETMQATGQSLMPEGLEKDISVQEMADLIAFLKTWRFLDPTTEQKAAVKQKQENAPR